MSRNHSMIEFVYAVQSDEELSAFREFSQKHRRTIEGYLAFLEAELEVTDPPRAIVLASERTATELVSSIPIPAYTNERRIVFTPDAGVWKRQYLSRLAGLDEGEARPARDYYESLGERQLLQIIGHELAHSSELFSDDAYEAGGAWFEEGAVEYVSRRYFLTADEFELERQLDKSFTLAYERRHPPRPLGKFGGEDEETRWYDYSRAFLRFDALVRENGDDPAAVIREYGENPNRTALDE